MFPKSAVSSHYYSVFYYSASLKVKKVRQFTHIFQSFPLVQLPPGLLAEARPMVTQIQLMAVQVSFI
jgi:hypothetical protein